MTQKNKNGGGIQEMKVNEHQLTALREQLIAKQFDGVFQPKLRSQTWPEQLKFSWLNNALYAMEFAAPLLLGITIEEMVDIISAVKADMESHEKGEPSKLNLYQIAHLSNNLEKRTPNQLILCWSSYTDVMLDAKAVQVRWNEICSKLRDETIEQISSQLNIKEAPPVGESPVVKGHFGPASEA